MRFGKVGKETKCNSEILMNYCIVFLLFILGIQVICCQFIKILTTCVKFCIHEAGHKKYPICEPDKF